MLVMSVYYDLESVEVLVEFVNEKDEFDSDEVDSHTVSGSEDSGDELWTI